MLRAACCLVLLAACARPTFNDDTCPFTLDPSQVQGSTVRCGVLQVPEVHGQLGAKIIDVPVVVFVGKNSDSPPIVNLAGGPGQSWGNLGISRIPAALSRDFSRDVIFLEQRGAAVASPKLTCPPQSGRESAAAYVRRCLLSIESIGANPEAYNSEELAHDVAGLREALGYDRLVLSGVSYGTAWAQEVMRRYPEILDSVVLDSVLSPATPPLSQIASAQESALDALFRECRADDECWKTFGDLQRKMRETLTALEQKPLPTSGKGTMGPDGYFSLVMWKLSSSPHTTPAVIDYLYDLLPDGVVPVEDAQSGPAESAIALGQYFSVMCSDNQLVTQEQIAADRASVRAWLRPYVSDGSELRSLCNEWRYKRRPADALSPIEADVPTLLLAGSLDFATPPKWAREVAASLPRAFLLEAPGVGHGVGASGDACVSHVTRTFLFTPSNLSLVCAGQMRAHYSTGGFTLARDERPRLRLPGTRLIDRLPRF
jgi:pimeloyl-ACP methyl ester carboxylesterase